jgi:hypothetical protein
MTKADCEVAVQVVTAWLEVHDQAELASRLWYVAGVEPRRAVPIPVDVEHVIDQVDELLTRLGYEDLAMDVAVATEPEPVRAGVAVVVLRGLPAGGEGR